MRWWCNLDDLLAGEVLDEFGQGGVFLLVDELKFFGEVEKVLFEQVSHGWQVNEQRAKRCMNDESVCNKQ